MASGKKQQTKKFPKFMKRKLVVFFGILLACLCALMARIMYINYNKGEAYKKKVLSLQNYDSQTIPYQRGDIVDTNGTVLATSVAVYNVILDCTLMGADEGAYVDATVSALVSCFPDLNEETLRGYAAEEDLRPYIVLEKKLTYDEIQPFVEMQEAVDEDGKKVNPNIKGVWFETEYERAYPYSTLAADVIGFTSSGDVGTTGLENYYDDILNGTNGREYGYLNSDSDFEKTVIPAENGYSIQISLDENIQSIVEEKISEFNEAYTDNYREGDGAENIAVLIMDPNTGEVLAMASSPSYDLNDPRNLSAFYSQEELDAMTDEDTMNALNAIWQNFCVTSTYEPGSVQKPLTVSCGLETGTITDDMTFLCDGYEIFGDSTIHCVNRNGHGVETVQGALSDSCNDALMQMSYKIGATNFLNYQSIFGMGQKTGIDLPGEANTSGLVYTLDTIKPVDLATNSFGQNYNCTMIEMASAYCSLVNGGTYYQPHLVTRTYDDENNTISTVEPTALKQTVSQSTSDKIREYLYNVVSTGTGNTAKVDGYSMGGKTGTAQKLPRGDGNYLVSFMGFAPYEDPQLVIYCIVDTPNVKDQSHSAYAQNLTREILEEVLPYMNIFPDEEMTGANADKDITGGGYGIEEDPVGGNADDTTETGDSAETGAAENTDGSENSDTAESTGDANTTDEENGEAIPAE